MIELILLYNFGLLLGLSLGAWLVFFIIMTIARSNIDFIERLKTGFR